MLCITDSIVYDKNEVVNYQYDLCEWKQKHYNKLHRHVRCEQ